MSRLWFTLALLCAAAILHLAEAVSFTSTLTGSFYTDSTCTAGAVPFIVTSVEDDSGNIILNCDMAGKQFIQGHCVPQGFAGRDGSYSLVKYRNSTCTAGLIGSVSANTPIDTTACVALSTAAGGYVKFSSCSPASSLAVSVALLVALAVAVQHAKNLF